MNRGITQGPWIPKKAGMTVSLAAGPPKWDRYRLGRRKGLVKRGHQMGVQIIENQPVHRDIWVGLIHQPPHLVCEVLHGASLRYRHVAPTPAGLAGEEQVACARSQVLVVLTHRPPRLCRQRFPDVGQQLGL